MNAAATQAAIPAACMVAADLVVTSRNAPTERVSEPLTDAQRELAIIRAGQAIERHMGAYQALEQVHNLTGCFADIGDADRQLRMAHEAKDLMMALLRGRSPAQIHRMEVERGFA